MAGRRSASRQARWARGPIPCSPGLRRPEASMFGEVSNLSLFYTPPFSVELDAYCTVRPSRVTCHVRTTRGRGCKGVRGGGSRRACGARASGVEDRDEPAAQSRPGWRIETSLRRKAVRGGGSRRACGAPVLEGGMVKPEIAKTTEPKQSTHARGVYELCGGLGEPILHHIYENFPRKYPNFLNWA